MSQPVGYIGFEQFQISASNGTTTVTVHFRILSVNKDGSEDVFDGVLTIPNATDLSVVGIYRKAVERLRAITGNLALAET